MKEALKKYFGYESFRPHQEEIIDAAMGGRDILAILPTGSGKSLCYQLPALEKPGTCVVVSPLIALMKDQVDSLTQNGVSAAFLNSSLSGRESSQIQSNLKSYKLLYVAPERLLMPHFLEFLKSQDISFFAVDEAHCISQWGHAFRPEYRALAILRNEFPGKPIMALTATATPRVEQDIIQQLQFDQPAVVKGSFNRQNLFYRAHPRQDLEATLWPFLKEYSGTSGILYAGTKKKVDEFQKRLAGLGYPALRYHAGMGDEERKSAQEAFLQGDGTLMVATVAFGMGVHKPDIRFIVHLDMPQNIEQYYQETGRAGRDGLDSECLMFYSAQDFMLHKYFLEEFTDPLVKLEMTRKLQDMLAFAQSQSCRRVPLLRYFGETSEACGACDNCTATQETMDATELAQKILEGVRGLGYSFGASYLVDVLKGARTKKVLERGHDRIASHGVLSKRPEDEIRYCLQGLMEQGFLRVAGDLYPVVKLTERGADALEEGKSVFLRKKDFVKTPDRPAVVSKSGKASRQAADPALFEELRAVRRKLAAEAGVPPYIIFGDRSLLDMCRLQPQTSEAFLRVYGVGDQKLARYGQAFLTAIRAHLTKLTTFSLK